MDVIRRIARSVGTGPSFVASLGDEGLLLLVRHAAGWYAGITDSELLRRVADLAKTAQVDLNAVATPCERGRVLDLVQGRSRPR